MAHGITLKLRQITAPEPQHLHTHAAAVKVAGGFYRKPPGLTPYVNPAKDRSFPGKARRRARQAAQA